jgi:archaellum component FlaC
MSDQLQLKRRLLIEISKELDSIKQKAYNAKKQLEDLQEEIEYLRNKNNVFVDIYKTLSAEIKSLEGDAK